MPMFHTSISGLALAAVPKAREAPPFFPPDELKFDAIFLKGILFRARKLGYKVERSSIPVTMFRRFLRRLFDLLDTEPNIDITRFGEESGGLQLTWPQIRGVVERDESMVPAVQLNVWERINFVFVGSARSLLGSFFGVLVFATIFLNVCLIIAAWPQNNEMLQNICVIIFSVEYAGKLLCAPFIRHGIFDEDWLLGRVVLSCKDAATVVERDTRVARRLWVFVKTPQNCIDLASIAPFWLEIILGPAKVNLQFLRIFRLFRLFQVVKFGKFSLTINILGITLRKSLRALGVLVVYICLVALLAGAIIQQFEYPPKSLHGTTEEHQLHAFSNVLMSVKWTIGRLCSVHHSTPEKRAVVQHTASWVVAVFLGLIRGILFALPIAAITQAYREADEFARAQVLLGAELLKEQSVPLGSEWMMDARSPSIHIAIHSSSTDTESRAEPEGIAICALPLLEAKETGPVRVDVAVSGKLARSGTELRLILKWTPDGESRPKEQRPSGTLEVTLAGGTSFRGSSSEAWVVSLQVPVKQHVKEEWRSGASEGSASAPVWKDAKKAFQISWASGLPEEEVDFKVRLGELLEQQNRQIQRLKSMVESR